jgi:hypothetical protein
MTTLIAVAAGLTVGIGLYLTVGAVVGWQLLPSRQTLTAGVGRVRSAVARFAVAGLAGNANNIPVPSAPA